MKRKHKINFQEYISPGIQEQLKDNYSLFVEQSGCEISFDAFIVLQYTNNLFNEIGYLFKSPGKIEIGLDWIQERQKEYAKFKEQYLEIEESTFLAIENLTMLLNNVSDKIDSVEKQNSTIKFGQKEFLKYA